MDCKFGSLLFYGLSRKEVSPPFRNEHSGWGGSSPFMHGVLCLTPTGGTCPTDCVLGTGKSGMGEAVGDCTVTE